MKLDARSHRKVNCMQRTMFAIILPILTMASVALAQTEQLERVAGQRYESRPATRSLASKLFSNLSFTASSYLGGKLSIVPSDKSTLTVTYRKSFKADNREQAEEFADYVELGFEELENEFSISAETKSAPPWSGTDYSGNVYVEVEVPKNENLKIDIRCQLFTIDITGPFAAVDITNSLGEVAVAKINSKVRISSENSGVTVRDCTGPVTVSTSLRPLTLSHVDGKLGTIKLRNSNGKIILESVRGEIDARCENAPITGAGVRFESGHSLLVSENSNIDVDAEAVNGDLTIRGANGKIDLTLPANTSASYVLQIEEAGRIYTKSLPIVVEAATRTRVLGYSGASRNKIEVDMAGVGTVNLVGKPANRTSLR